MNNFLYHLNSALYNTNKLVFKFLLNWLLGLLALIVFVGIPAVIVLIFDDYNYGLIILIIQSLICMFAAIAYSIYTEKPEEPTFARNLETGIKVQIGKYGEPKTIKRSLFEALGWTFLGLIILALLFFIIALL